MWPGSHKPLSIKYPLPEKYLYDIHIAALTPIANFHGLRCEQETSSSICLRIVAINQNFLGDHVTLVRVMLETSLSQLKALFIACHVWLVSSYVHKLIGSSRLDYEYIADLTIMCEKLFLKHILHSPIDLAYSSPFPQFKLVKYWKWTKTDDRSQFFVNLTQLFITTLYFFAALSFPNSTGTPNLQN